ncbi:hypothetical protein BJX62DRAFT_204888 [Aspergillus germanicus]
MVLECQVALIAHFRRNGLFKFLRATAAAEDWVSTLQGIEKQDEHCQKLLNKYKDQGRNSTNCTAIFRLLIAYFRPCLPPG